MTNLEPLLGMLLILSGLTVTIRGMWAMGRGGYGAGSSIALGAFMAGLGLVGPVRAIEFFANAVLKVAASAGMADGEPYDPIDLTPDPKSDKPEPSSEPGESSAPEPEAAGSDTDLSEVGGDVLTWLLYLGGGALALAVVAGLVFGVVQLTAHTKKRRETNRAEIERLDRVWSEAVARHDQIRDNILKYQRDIDLVLSLPAINDVEERKTADFYTALAQAQDAWFEIRPESAKAVEAYAAATREASTRWDIALRSAEKVSLSKFTDAERTTIRRVSGLMAQARHGATPQERKAYYDQAVKLLNNLIALPKPAMEAIERQVRGELTASDSTGSPLGTELRSRSVGA